MAKDYEENIPFPDEKPDWIKPGKFENHTGTCEYCHQIRMVRCEPGLTQSEVDELATAECDCAQAKSAQKAITAAEVLKNKFLKKYNGVPKATRDVIIQSFYPVAAGFIKKVQISSDDGISYTVFRKESKLRFMRTVTDQEELDES